MDKVKKIIICSIIILVLLIGIVLGIFYFNKLNKVVSILTMDINPSIAISLNYKNDVLKVEGLNEDGKELLNKLESKESTVIYFGYSDCPWCRSIISTLTDVVIENNIDNFYYVNVKKIDKSTVNKIKIKLNDYLEENDNGIKTLYVPDVYFIKDGDIKYHYLSNIDSVKNPYKKMNEEQIKELKDIYQNGIDMIK